MSENALVVQGAEARASAFAYLKAHPGVRFNRITMAEAIGMSQWSCADALNALADSGQIKKVQEGPRKWYYFGELQMPLAGVPAEPPQRKQRQPRVQTLVPERQKAPGELEIEVAGVTLLVGRNPATGRVRIAVLEDHHD